MDISSASQLPSPDGSIGVDPDGTLDGVDIPTGHHHGGSRFRDGDDTPMQHQQLQDAKKGRKRFSRRQSKGGLAAVF
jgi:hypothetical protein